MPPSFNSLLTAFVTAFTLFCPKSIPGQLIYKYLAHPACPLRILAENQLFQLTATSPQAWETGWDYGQTPITSCRTLPRAPSLRRQFEHVSRFMHTLQADCEKYINRQDSYGKENDLVKKKKKFYSVSSSSMPVKW